MVEWTWGEVGNGGQEEGGGLWDFLTDLKG